MHRYIRNTYTFFVGKSGGKKHLGRPSVGSIRDKKCIYWLSDRQFLEEGSFPCSV
jgi:hypothetical protein